MVTSIKFYLHHLYLRFDNKVYRQTVGIRMGIYSRLVSGLL